MSGAHGADPVCISYAADEIIVEHIVRQLVHFDVVETGPAQIIQRPLPAPHGSQTLAALGERDAHAVHARDGVEKRAQRVIAVVMMVTGAVDVLREVDAARREAAANAREHIERSRLIVDRIEGRDQVEGALLGRLIEVAEIPRLERHIGKPRLCGALARPRDGLCREVVARETALGKTPRQLQ